MAMGRLREISARLMEGGMGPGTLVSVVEWGTTRRQRSLRGELGAIADLVEAAGMGPPAVVIIGEVAGLGETLEWFDPAI
jgi:uroporphyrinogen III methyltransferase/synthase